MFFPSTFSFGSYFLFHHQLPLKSHHSPTANMGYSLIQMMKMLHQQISNFGRKHVPFRFPVRIKPCSLTIGQGALFSNGISRFASLCFCSFSTILVTIHPSTIRSLLLYIESSRHTHNHLHYFSHTHLLLLPVSLLKAWCRCCRSWASLKLSHLR